MTITAHNLRSKILELQDIFESYSEEKEVKLKIFKERIEAIKDLASRYAGIDGEHHKQWLIDQIIRVVLAGDYQDFIAEYNNFKDQDGKSYGEWDEGIAP